MAGEIITKVLASIFTGLGKVGISKLKKTETVQRILKDFNLTSSQNDFVQRYIESLVELHYERKEADVVQFFREKRIQELFYNYYYGGEESRFNQSRLDEELKRWMEVLEVGDDIKKRLAIEIPHFWEIFKQKIHLSSSVTETVTQNKLNSIDNKLDSALQNIVPNIKKFLTAPPFDPPVFIGRDEELITVHDKLFAGENFLMLVNGQGGMGKTSFASKYWKTYEGEYHHLAYVLVENGIANALLSIAGALKLEFENQMPVEERLEKLLHAISQLEKPCLLFLDNANDYEDLEKEMVYLRKCSNCHLLVTSRLTSIDGVSQYSINQLPGAFPLALFKTYYSQHNTADDNLFEDIFKAVGGNTLVVEVLAKNLREINQNEVFYPLSALLNDLQSKGLLQLTEQADIKANWGKFAKNKPEAILGAMYELHPLDEASLQVLSNFALLPPENISYLTLKTLLAPENSRVFSDTLTVLWRKGWIEKNLTKGELHYKCSPVVQEIVRLKNPTIENNCANSIKTLIKILSQNNIHEDDYKTASYYARLAESVVVKLPQSNYDASELHQYIGHLSYAIGNYENAIRHYSSMKDIITSLSLSSLNNEHLTEGIAFANEQIGNCYYKTGHFEKAILCYKNELNLYESILLYSNNKIYYLLKKFQTLVTIGKAHTILRQTDESFECYENAIEIAKFFIENGFDNFSFLDNYTVLLERLGALHNSVGDITRGAYCFELALQIYPSLFQHSNINISFYHGEAITKIKLGNIYIDQGKYEDGIFQIESGIACIENLSFKYTNNLEFKTDLAWAKQKLAKVKFLVNDIDSAIALYSQSIMIYEELATSNQGNIMYWICLVDSYTDLGRFYNKITEYDHAIIILQKAETVCLDKLKIFPNNKPLIEIQMEIFIEIGTLYLQFEKKELARDYLVNSLKIALDLHKTNPESNTYLNSTALASSYLGAIELELGEHTNAYEHFLTSIRIMQELINRVPDSINFKNGLALSYCKLGVFNRDNLGNTELALTNFNCAKSIWESLIEINPNIDEFQKYFHEAQNEIIKTQSNKK